MYRYKTTVGAIFQCINTAQKWKKRTVFFKVFYTKWALDSARSMLNATIMFLSPIMILSPVSGVDHNVFLVKSMRQNNGVILTCIVCMFILTTINANEMIVIICQILQRPHFFMHIFFPQRRYKLCLIGQYFLYFHIFY